ncbi:MAG: YraN family protein [Alphaproteobacteria bacterium]
MTRSRNERRLAERRGRLAETLALLLLRLKGWRILARRFRVGAGSGVGEIDLVARRGRMLAFIEVKARETLADAAFSITPRQRSRITRGAEAFLQAHPHLADLNMRFDALLLGRWRWPVHLVNVWRIGE